MAAQSLSHCNDMPNSNPATQRPSLKAPKISWAATLMFTVAALLLVFGWRIRNEHYLTAEYGIGYALGIIGGVMMLLLLLYPMRKRLRFMRFLGPVKYWFSLHMFFGVFGPTAILYHASFHHGSLNSTVALYAMLIVAGSGLIGRFFYTRIHLGLHGQRATLAGLKRQSEQDLQHFAWLSEALPEVSAELDSFESRAVQPTTGIIDGSLRALQFAVTTRTTYYRLRRRLLGALKHSISDPRTRREQSRIVRHYLHNHLFTLRKIAELSLYERLFSWWHVLHLPLFIMLIISGITHVVAVHMY